MAVGLLPSAVPRGAPYGISNPRSERTCSGVPERQFRRASLLPGHLDIEKAVGGDSKRLTFQVLDTGTLKNEGGIVGKLLLRVLKILSYRFRTAVHPRAKLQLRFETT